MYLDNFIYKVLCCVLCSILLFEKRSDTEKRTCILCAQSAVKMLILPPHLFSGTSLPSENEHRNGLSNLPIYQEAHTCHSKKLGISYAVDM